MKTWMELEFLSTFCISNNLMVSIENNWCFHTDYAKICLKVT